MSSYLERTKAAEANFEGVIHASCDDVIDDLFDRVKQELIEIIQKNSDFAGQAADLLMVAKYFERIGDHATNIAEWVIFSITGKHE